VKNVMSRIGAIAVGKGNTLEARGMVKVGKNGLDEGAGAHGKSDLAESVHGGDHAVDHPIQLVRGDHQTCDTAGFTVELLYPSQWKGVGGEGTGFGPGEEDREASIRAGQLHEGVMNHGVPTKFLEADQVWEERGVRGEEVPSPDRPQAIGRAEHTDLSTFVQGEEW